MLKSKYVQWPWLILLLASPVILWILPSDFFDAEDGIKLCMSQILFDAECWGCGMTRAVMHLHHFELADAIYYNMGVVVVYPALIVVWFLWVKNARAEIYKDKPSEAEQPVT